MGQAGNKGIGTSLIYTVQLRFGKFLASRMNGTAVKAHRSAVVSGRFVDVFYDL
jgi:hypothetical protein